MFGVKFSSSTSSSNWPPELAASTVSPPNSSEPIDRQSKVATLPRAGRWNDFAFRLLRASLVGSFSLGLLCGRQFVFDLLDVGRCLRMHVGELAELCWQVAIEHFSTRRNAQRRRQRVAFVVSYLLRNHIEDQEPFAVRRNGH